MYKNFTFFLAVFLVSMRISAQNAADTWSQAINLSAFLTNNTTPVSTPLYSNVGATAEMGLAGVTCFSESDYGDTILVDNSIWFEFQGNGLAYKIQSAPCNAGANYLDGGDTQMALYEDSGSNLTPMSCNEDLGYSTFGDFRAGVVVTTQIGSNYRLMVDGFGGASGSFCLVFSPTVVNDDCATAADISSNFGQPIDTVSLSAIFENTTATTSTSDPSTGFDCFYESNGPTLENTTFYTFVGDGNYYQIETADCAGVTDYNDDTQMAIYQGSGCNFATPIACNEDFGGDYHAGIRLLTVPGQQYVMMIDGWGGNTGEFCVSVTRLQPIGCADAVFGAAADNDVNICFDGSVTLSLDSATTVVPNLGISGFSWLISSAPFPAAYAGAPEDFQDYITETGLFGVYYDFPIVNDPADPIPAGTYYITPYMTADNGAGAAICHLYGATIVLHAFDELMPLTGNSAVSAATAAGNDGSISLVITGGSSSYTYLWSNNSTTQNQTGLAAGSYSVTVSDISGCVAPVILTINVPQAGLIANDECANAANISAYFGQPIGMASVTPIYNNEGATASASDPTSGYDCFSEGPSTLDNTTFYEFTGDGNFYQISTVPCPGVANYNDDTQIAIYEGSACNYGQSVTCNDDLFADGQPDYRAGTSLITVPGQQYIMMIDGWDGTAGDFCIEITQIQPVGCAQAQLGAAEVDELNLCFDGTATFILDGNATVVPNVGPIAGFTWVISSEPYPAGYSLSPDNLPGFLGYTGIAPIYYDFPIENDPANPIPQSTYFITPYLVSGATQVGLDPIGTTGGCTIYGPSLTLNTFEELPPLASTSTVLPAIIPNNNGSIVLNVTGGSDIYSYEWSNGKTTANIGGLAAGVYKVTVTDFSGCTPDLILTFTVQSIVETENLPNVLSLQMMPNPTNGPLNFSIQLVDNQPVMVKLVNSLGQIIDQQKMNESEKMDGSFDLSHQSAGVYFLRFDIGTRTAERRIVLVK
jgi:hypothetical protein